jgi:hypothetical protein
MQYTVNYNQVICNPDLSQIVKTLAKKITENPYMLVSDFFKSLSDSEVDELSEMVNSMNDDTESLKNLLLISQMLSRAEGLSPETDEEEFVNLEHLVVWIVCVSLEREGRAKVFYENMSFGQEFNTAKIVEKV